MFPDVVAKTAVGSPILGIEVKVWYLLAKEEEPTFRFQTSATACAPGDFIVVVPWRFSNLLDGGSPVLHEPFVVNARFAAEQRNWHWLNTHADKPGAHIRVPANALPYPQTKTHSSDEPYTAAGKSGVSNFGRLARCGLTSFERYVTQQLDTEVDGEKLRAWIDFLR